MGRNESTVELLVKVWEGIREFLEVPNESTGSFFRHMRVIIFSKLSFFSAKKHAVFVTDIATALDIWSKGNVQMKKL